MTSENKKGLVYTFTGKTSKNTTKFVLIYFVGNMTADYIYIIQQ
jgi:hypothetical protein